MKNRLSFRKGFTLIELLIVITVIGILAVSVIAIVNPAAKLQKARDSNRKSDLSQIQKTFETFYQDYGRYPEEVDNKIKRTDGAVCSGSGCAANWGSTLWAPYMSVLPKDPSSTKNYIYSVSANGQTYYLYASLERGGEDLQACFSDGSPCSSSVANGVPTACGGNCNYGITSPNVSP